MSQQVSWAFNRATIVDEDEVFENHHFIIVKRLLMVVCIWPYQSKRLKFYGRAFIIFAIFTMMIPQMIKFYEEFYEVDQDLQILAENFSGFLYFSMMLSKLFMSIHAEKKLQHLYERITKDYKEIREPREKAAMDELRDLARTLTIIYATFLFITIFVFVFTPQAVPAILDVIWPLNESRHKTICYYAEYFIDQDEYLYILVFHTFVVVAITIILLNAVDCSFVVVTYHVLGLFNVLMCRLKQLSEWADDSVNREDKRLHRFVIDTIKIHKKTLDFAETVRSTYDLCNFIVITATLLALSIGTIDVAMNLTTPEVIIRIGAYFVAVIIKLFFLNWPGQRFLDSSDNLAKSIYFCNWYKFPKRTQFLMRFMMMRCLIPCQLTAGPLFQMNFAFFSTVLRTALSYFTTVYSLR